MTNQEVEEYCRGVLNDINYDDYSGRHSTNVVENNYTMDNDTNYYLRDLAIKARKIIEYQQPEDDQSGMLAFEEFHEYLM